MRQRHHRRPLGIGLAAAVSLGMIISVSAISPVQAATSDNLATGKTITASGSVSPYQPGNANDGDRDSYWESVNHSFPQWLQVDLATATEVNEIVLALPATWEARTQTLSLSGGTDESGLSTVVASAEYTFDPDGSNEVTIDFSTVTVRYLRLVFTGNTTWPAGQVAEWEVYGPASSSPTPSSPESSPTTPTGSNLAMDQPATASSTVDPYQAANATDGDVTTYWEGAANTYPNTLTVDLGANAITTTIVVRLNPDPAWSARTQTIEVLGREQSADDYATLVPATIYSFDPDTDNTVTISVDATISTVRLDFTANSGATAGQVAELEVYGSAAPNPDLSVTALSWSPETPVETDEVTVSVTVRNGGTAAALESQVSVYLGTTLAGSAVVRELPAEESTTVRVALGPIDTGTYSVSATADAAGAVIELDEGNNTHTSSEELVVTPVDSADLVASLVAWTPSRPAAGETVTFTITLANQGTQPTASTSHGLTLTVIDDSTGASVTELTGTASGPIGAGAMAAPVAMGSWTAVDGEYTLVAVVAVDPNEVTIKQDNNTSTSSLSVGRGASMPYDTYQAEDGVTGGGATVVGPNRTVGDLAGEASERMAVVLDTTGAYVEFTTRASTNTLVLRFSIPDASGGGGTESTLNVYVDGSFRTAIDLTSHYAWLYGAETSPSNTPSSGDARHIYDEANLVLGTTVPAGSVIRLQKDAANTSDYYAIDFVDLEQATEMANPDPNAYVVPDGHTQQDVQDALDTVRMDTTGTLVGVYLPAGDYTITSKLQVYGKAIEVIGAGPWYTRFLAPADQENTDVGFSATATANGSTFANFALFGNYTSRVDGPGKVFDLSSVSDITIDNIWTEHMVCMYWGANTDNMTITNSRVRNTFADGINMTNGSTDNLISDVEARATGDDSFALFSAIDSTGGDQTGNVYQNLTSLLTWRAAGVAVYGGYGNTFQNILIADTLVYSGITISSLDFGYEMNGFGASPVTQFSNITILRAGGHFWGAQTFPAIWCYSASEVFQGIRVSDVDIVDPTYSGIMFQTNYVDGIAENPITDTVFTNVSISGAHSSGDAYDARSGFGIWANELPEEGQGPAVGEVTFNNLSMSDNDVDIQNTTSTFVITVNNE